MLRAASVFVALSVCLGASAQTGPNAFSFVAFGDVPYRDPWIGSGAGRARP